MINSEIAQFGARMLRHTWSDTFKLVQDGTGGVYEEAYDLLDSPATYHESEEPLGTEEVST